jgi:hypothetical protein
MPLPNVTRCSSCNRAIIWTVSVNGARLPVDARPVTVYALRESADQVDAVKVGGFVADGAVPDKVYVSHYLTCLYPERHTRRSESRVQSELRLLT